MNNRTTQVVVAVLVIVLLWLLLAWEPGDNSGGTLATRPGGGEFSLQSADGPVNLKDYRGKVVVLYFGYTFCPDICPTSLSLLSVTLNELSTEELRQVQAIFVSVDPERDTLEHLKTYTGYFHTNLIGATGSREQIDTAVKRYGAGYNIDQSASKRDYPVDHSSYTYIIDKGGKLRYTLIHGTSADEINTSIRSLL